MNRSLTFSTDCSSWGALGRHKSAWKMDLHNRAAVNYLADTSTPISRLILSTVNYFLGVLMNLSVSVSFILLLIVVSVEMVTDVEL